MLAAVLGGALIISLLVIWNDHKTIKALQDPAHQNITAQRDIIREDCSATDPVSKEKCADDLQALSELLGEFSKTLPAGVESGGVSNIKVNSVPKQ